MFNDAANPEKREARQMDRHEYIHESLVSLFMIDHRMECLIGRIVGNDNIDPPPKFDLGDGKTGRVSLKQVLDNSNAAMEELKGRLNERLDQLESILF